MIALPDLSPRQLEVLALAGNAMSSRAIGEELGLTRRTVEFYLSEIRTLFGTNKTFACVLAAVAGEMLILDHNGCVRVPEKGETV